MSVVPLIIASCEGAARWRCLSGGSEWNREAVHLDGLRSTRRLIEILGVGLFVTSLGCKEGGQGGMRGATTFSGGLSLSLVVCRTRLLIMNGIFASHQLAWDDQMSKREAGKAGESRSGTTGYPMK